MRRKYETTSITIRETKLLKKGIVKTNANLLNYVKKREIGKWRPRPSPIIRPGIS